MNQRLLRASSGGSAAFSWYWSRRWVLVKEPSISGTMAEGRKKTSVLMSAVFSSPDAISGELRQKAAVSVS